MERDCQTIGLLCNNYIQFPISSMVARLRTAKSKGAKRWPVLEIIKSNAKSIHWSIQLCSFIDNYSFPSDLSIMMMMSLFPRFAQNWDNKWKPSRDHEIIFFVWTKANCWFVAPACDVIRITTQCDVINVITRATTTVATSHYKVIHLLDGVHSLHVFVHL